MLLKRPAPSTFSTSIQQQNDVTTINDYNLKAHPNSTLVSSLQGMGIPIKEEDISKPKLKRITHLFECLFDILVPWRAEILAIESEKAKNLLEYAPNHFEISEEFIDVAILYREMKAFLLDIRFSDFTLKDILQPKQDRLTAILSAIANYSMHSEAAWGSYEPIAEENENWALEAFELSRETDELERLIEERSQLLDEEDELANQELLETPILEEALLTSRKESEFVVSELKELKDERQQLRDKLQEVQYTVVDSKHISQNLQTAVQVDFNISLETNRALMDAIIKGEQELEELAEMIKQFDEEYGFNKLLHTSLEKCLEVLKDVQEYHNTSTRQNKTYEALGKEHDHSDATIREINKHFSSTERILQSTDFKIKSLEESLAMKRESMKQYYLERIESKLESKKFEDECTREAQANEEEARSYMKEILLIEEEFKRRINNFYEKLVDAQGKTYQFSSKVKQELFDRPTTFSIILPLSAVTSSQKSI